MASAEPWTSALMRTGSSETFLECSLDIMSTSETWLMPPVAFSRFTRSRYSVSSRARASESTTARGSPGLGASFRPRISTGTDGPASVSCSLRSFSRARTLPQAEPATTMSPRRRVPRLTSTVATGPRPLSSLASMTTPSEERSGSALRSIISACTRMASIRPSRLVRFLAETSMIWVSPPRLSAMTSYCSSSLTTLSALASGLSILLTATMIGALAALACWMASMVWGMTPSSAATTSTTMSVTLAPRARIAEKAAWPGVSRKVTRSSLGRRT